MVTFQKNLVAAADAHQLVAKLSKARGGVSGPGEEEDCEAEQECLERFAAVLPSLVWRGHPCPRTAGSAKQNRERGAEAAVPTLKLATSRSHVSLP